MSNKCDSQGWPQDALQAVEAQLRRMQTSGSEKFQVDDRSFSSDTTNKPRIHVDLPSEQSALPYNWEQFLDINTGEVYYIDWTTCKRTNWDPREAARLAENKVRAIREDCLSRERLSSNSLTSTTASGSSSFDKSSASSSSSETFPTPPGRRGGEDGSSQVDENEEEESCEDSSHDDVMVSGCKRCLTYCLVERHRPVCPSCGSHLQVMH